MPPPAQPLSPAELAALEHAFASDSGSEAYRPLAEAYLGMKRFMEAMVVCKRGVKGHPGDVSARVLLARIYAAQGKNKKAVEELAAGLALDPKHVAANRMLGLLQLELGEKEPGLAAIRRAHEAAPADPETLEAMRKWGLLLAPAQPTAKAIGTAPSTPTPIASATPTRTPASSAPPTSATVPATEAALDGDGTPPVLYPPASASPPPPARNAAYAEALADRYATREFPLNGKGVAPAKRSRTRLFVTVGLGLALVLALGGYGIVSSMRKAREVEIDRLLKEARELLEKDSYASYKEAGKRCEAILARDPDSIGGHAYLAYVDAIRWGEHGESEGLRDEAKKHLDAVAKLKRQHSHAIAAAAYLRFYGGDVKGAIAELNRAMAGPEGASSLLRGVLGVLQMQAGDLDAAREALGIARQSAPGDVRITQMLAEQWRRRGQGFEVQANALYDTVLTRLAPDHVPSLLGKAQLLLDAGKPDEAGKRIEKVLGMGQGASPRQAAVALALHGSVLHAQGKAEKGDEEEKQALANDAGNPEIYDLIGRRKARGGDVTGAVESFQKALELDPGRLLFYVNLANAYLARPNGAKQAVAALEKASDRVGTARVTKLLGDAYRADGDLDRAARAYEKAIGMEKTYPEARVALAHVLREKKDYGRALEELDRAIKESTGTAAGSAASAWVELGETEEARGSAPDAVERAYTNALKAEPTSCPALFWLGRSRSDRSGRVYNPPLATQMLSDYLRLCPKAPRAGDAQRMLAALQQPPAPARAPAQRHRRR